MKIELFLNDNALPYILSETSWWSNILNGIYSFSGNGPFACSVRCATYVINNIIFIKYKRYDCRI